MSHGPKALFEHSLRLKILRQRVQICCDSPEVQALLRANFGTMTAAIEDEKSDLQYTVHYTGSEFTILREGQLPLIGAGLDDLLFYLEKSIIVELQKRRADLLFLHAAAVERAGKACLLAAEAGSGKSTTTWALLHNGFAYLSDELSPIDLDSLAVFPYPHALCFKQPSAAPYELPEQAIHLGRTIHVPGTSSLTTDPSAPCGIGAVFLVQYRPELEVPSLRAMTPAEASARLYVTALNPLSHPNRGLDAVLRIAENVPCFSVDSTADLSATCALIDSVIP